MRLLSVAGLPLYRCYSDAEHYHFASNREDCENMGAESRGDLGLIDQSCRLARGKRYYSADRRSSIVTDVSIELYVGKARRPAILWVWECKDYSGAVPKAPGC
jgi:hypothetical protein